MLESPNLNNVTPKLNNNAVTLQAPLLITVIFEVSGDKSPLSVSGVTVTV